MSSVKVDRSAITTMLETLFGYTVEDGFRIFVAQEGNFAGWWFDSIDAAAKKLSTSARSMSTWIGVGVRHDVPDEGRGMEDEIGGIVAMWADIDVAHEVHKKADRLPKTYGDALEIVSSTFHSTPPTMVVDSGHGVQAWWVLDEPWIFESDQDRAAAKALSTRFAATIRAECDRRGFTVDSVFDLSRLMRPAGTINHKTKDDPKPVKILEHSEGLRWSRDDIDAVCVAEEFLPKGYRAGADTPIESVGLLTLSPNAQPPMRKLAALLSNSTDASLSFENKRDDFSDQSASSYDLSLATFAAQAEWTDQEIADLLIAHRRENGHDLKTTGRGAIRQDYYQRTIARAREGIGREAVTTDLNQGTSQAPTVAGGSVTDEQRAKILRDASYVLGVAIDRFVQFGDGEDASYLLELKNGKTVTIGNSKAIQQQKNWAAKLFPVSRRLFEPLKPRGWVSLVNSLATIVEFEENAESSRYEQVTDLLATYLANSMTRTEEDYAAAVKAGNPVQRDGAVYVSRSHFDQWLRASQSNRLDMIDVQATLRSLGFRQRTISANAVGKRVSKRYWCSPLDECGGALGLIHTSEQHEEATK